MWLNIRFPWRTRDFYKLYVTYTLKCDIRFNINRCEIIIVRATARFHARNLMFIPTFLQSKRITLQWFSKWLQCRLLLRWKRLTIAFYIKFNTNTTCASLNVREDLINSQRTFIRNFCWQLIWPICLFNNLVIFIVVEKLNNHLKGFHVEHAMLLIKNSLKQGNAILLQKRIFIRWFSDGVK